MLICYLLKPAPGFTTQHDFDAISHLPVQMKQDFSMWLCFAEPEPLGFPLRGDAMHLLQAFVFKLHRYTMPVNGVPGKTILTQLIMLVVTMKELFSL